MAYVTGAEATDGGKARPKGCPFCVAPTLPVDEGLVVARGEVVYALLNLYPYNPGHLMVCPYRHVADYTDLDAAETIELAQFSQLAMSVIRRVSGPAGFNLGMNQGHVAGAGIASHLHQHVVPRWAGDTNFMPVIGRTKTLPQLLADTRALLAGAWADVEAEQGRAKPAKYTRKRPGSTVDKAPARAGATRAAAARTPAKAATRVQAQAVKAAKAAVATTTAASRAKAAKAQARANAATAPAKAAPAHATPAKAAPAKAAPAKAAPPKAAKAAKAAAPAPQNGRRLPPTKS